MNKEFSDKPDIPVIPDFPKGGEGTQGKGIGSRLYESLFHKDNSDVIADNTGSTDLPDFPENPFDGKRLVESPSNALSGIEVYVQKYHSQETKETQSDEDEKEREQDADEKAEKKGGSYKDVRKTSDGETEEVHHMPADSVSPLERGDGPSIKMSKEDHAETASFGASKEARDYRQKQKELIEQGKFLEALKMDIEDIISKFGDKYNEEIKEMLDYVKELVDKGIINDEAGILDELYAMIGYGGDVNEEVDS